LLESILNEEDYYLDEDVITEGEQKIPVLNENTDIDESEKRLKSLAGL